MPITKAEAAAELTPDAQAERDLARLERIEWAIVWAGLLAVTLISIHSLRRFPDRISWVDAWRGIRPLLLTTGWAALKLWAFWAVSAAVLAGLYLGYDPSIAPGDALLAGAAGLWAIAWLLGSLLGPLGLFRAPLVAALLAAGVLRLWRHPPRVAWSAPGTGAKLALLAWGLLAVSMLPMQLGAPVPPYMDVLSYPASVQRILTFHRYLPFNNDPWGGYGPYAQTPALELFYAMLALGGHIRLGVLAESAAMVPMAGMIIFGAWRLGTALFDDASGGGAALLLFFTCLFRRAQGMRGTAVAFALVGFGLAFLLELRRNRTLAATGAVLLGTAVASHALDGAFAMAVAGMAAAMWLVEGGWALCAAGLGCLVGAALIGLPEFFIGSVRSLPYPALPLMQMAGLGAILLSVRAAPPPAAVAPRAPRWINLGLVLALAALIGYRHYWSSNGVLAAAAENSPALAILCAAGLIAAAARWCSERDAMRYGGLVAFALLLGIAAEYLGYRVGMRAATVEGRAMASEIGFKLQDYWYPYFMAIGAGALFGFVYQRVAQATTLFALLALLIYPWHRVDNPNYADAAQHSIPEQWAFNLSTAAHGYFFGAADSRWIMGPDGFALVEVLEGEVAAGRITPATHILHLTADIAYWRSVQYQVYTGINDDPMITNYNPGDPWEAGGRVAGWDQLPAALGRRPPYILEQVAPPRWLPQPPAGYETIFSRGDLRLFRRLGVAQDTAARTGAS